MFINNSPYLDGFNNIPMFNAKLKRYMRHVIVHQKGYYFEFATNFGFDINFGENVKFGLKFGGSTKQIREQTYTIATTEGADFLGDYAIYFSDPIATRLTGSRGITGLKGTVIGTSDEYVNFVIIPQQRLN